jgi:hypothetical protein
MSEPTLLSACKSHGVELNLEHYDAVAGLFNGALLKALLALIAKDATLLVPIMPALIADIAAGNWAAAFLLITTTLAGTPATTT